MTISNIPQYGTRLTDPSGNTMRAWYIFWQNIAAGAGSGGAVAPVTVGASPFTYSATVAGTLIIQGGTISKVQFSRDGVTFYKVGTFRGMFPMSAGDAIQVTWATVSPVLTFIPR